MCEYIMSSGRERKSPGHSITVCFAKVNHVLLFEQTELDGFYGENNGRNNGELLFESLMASSPSPIPGDRAELGQGAA